MKAILPAKTTYTTKKFVLRLPIDIHERILHTAKHHRRSMNAEIIHHLDKTLLVSSIQTHSTPKKEAALDEHYFLKLLQTLPAEKRTAILFLLESFNL